MKVPFLDLSLQHREIKEEITSGIEAVCESGRFACGPPVARFERAFADYCETEHCVALNSGTSALHVAMRCLDIGRGDEVITTPMTFVATAWAISYVGANPVFVDIDPSTRNLDPNQLAAAITPRTKAIVPVHLYGRPAAMDQILAIGRQHDLPVVEDGAQAHGARFQGTRVGGLGRIGCFSFYPGKNLGAYGEGGALVTNDEAIASRARALRDHAQSQRYQHDELGYNYRMDSFQGVVLEVKLRRLEHWNAARRRNAEAYRERLLGIPGIVLPPVDDVAESVWHLFVVEVDDRDRIATRLQDAGVACGLHYPVPVHLQPAYQELGLKAGAFPHAERLAQRCLSVPFFPGMTDKQIEYVSRNVVAALQ